MQANNGAIAFRQVVPTGAEHGTVMSLHVIIKIQQVLPPNLFSIKMWH